MSNWLLILLAIGSGGTLMIHCARAAVRELRTGIAIGRDRNYARRAAPAQFWSSILATALAALMGLLFFLWGLVFMVLELK